MDLLSHQKQRRRGAILVRAECRDQVLSYAIKVLRGVGVFHKDDPRFKLYASKKIELSVEDDFFLYGARLVVELV